MTPSRPLVAALLGLLSISPAAAERRVSVLIDTSGSMLRNDAPLYTVQLAKILGDLTEPGDRYQVTRLPPTDSEVDICDAPPTEALRLAMRSGDYAGFKAAIQGFIGRYNGGNKFAGSIHTALQLLTLDPAQQRLLLFIADSGGLSDECEGSLTRELQAFRNSGGMVAAVNIGSSTGGFGGNPAFNFTRAASNSSELIEAVAEVYQRFLGSREAKTGRLSSGSVEVEVGPYVKEAFLVVAVDGEIGAIQPDPSNPSAKNADLNLRGGGQTVGLDGRTRSYRIVRLTHPQGGRWRFQAGSASGGWMLLEESAIAIRPLESVTAGPEALLTFEVYDERTGERIVGGSHPPIQAEVEVDGQRLALRDDGNGGDKTAGDGVLTAVARLPQTGRRTVSAMLKGGDLERRLSLSLDVREPGWKLEPQLPARAEVGDPLLLEVRARSEGGGADKPAYLDARVAGGASVQLRDDGTGGDRTAGDGVYSASWTPPAAGEVAIVVQPPPGVRGEPVERKLEALGKLSFSGAPPAVRLGPVGSGEEAAGKIDLSGAAVQGEVTLTVDTDLDLSNTELLIETDAGWTNLHDNPSVRLRSDGRRQIGLRLAVAACPTACAPEQAHTVTLRAPRADGSVVEIRAPLVVEVVGDPFLKCYWPWIAAAVSTLLGAIVAYGYISPSRFGARDGVQISQEADLSEGFFYPFRAQPGSGVGLYRDARLYLSSDYRLSGRRVNVLAKLRADRGRVKIEPAPGQSLWRETIDGDWEELPPEETQARTGVVYRNHEKTLYFELRTGG
ncbi:MAG: hypothetical protein GC160_07830 [Acidobacteria bacterium]|nr:hypothetical protein [Acidobacteriota bacterium]